MAGQQQMNQERAIWDVVIIGGGLAGLTASVFLARGGKSVLVLEKSPAAGGRAMSTRKEGGIFNLGPHALYKNGAGAAVWDELGIQPHGEKPKAQGPLVFGKEQGSEKAVPMLQLFLGSALSWPEKMELLRFYRGLRKIDTKEDALQRTSLQSYLESHIKSPVIRSAIGALVRVSSYSNAPERVSAGAVLGQLQMGQVLYLHGGWQKLVDEVQQKAEEAGVSFSCGASVHKIEGRSPEMSVTLKDGTVFAARTVLSTAGPKETAAMLGGGVLPEEIRRWDDLIPVHAACLDLHLSAMPNPKLTFSLGVDQPWYFSNHSYAASLTEDPGHSVVHVMKYLPPESMQDAAMVKHELERFVDMIQPGWREHVVNSRFMPHLTVTHALVTASMGGIKGRPAPEVASWPGLYVAGDWVGAEGMLLDASLASARQAAACIMGKKLQLVKAGIF